MIQRKMTVMKKRREGMKYEDYVKENEDKGGGRKRRCAIGEEEVKKNEEDGGDIFPLGQFPGCFLKVQSPFRSPNKIQDTIIDKKLGSLPVNLFIISLLII